MLDNYIILLLLSSGAGAPEEDELFEQGVVESNCVYRLVDNRLVPHEEAWASIPSTSLLGSTEVRVSVSHFCSLHCFLNVGTFKLQDSGGFNNSLGCLCLMFLFPGPGV